MPADPFSALTFIGAPAILTNATSVMILSTSNRLARSVTRARDLTEKLAVAKDQGESDYLTVQLRRAERRVLVTVRAITSLYLAIGAFAAATLAAFIGTFGTSGENGFGVDITVALTMAAGIFGLGALIAGAFMLVFESHLAYRNLRLETERARSRVH